MKNISELTLLTDQSTIKWNCMGEAFLFSCSEADQVLADESRDLIFVLDQKKNLPERLTIINAQGKILSTFSSPDGGAFYYMTVGSKKEVLVVCVFTEKFDGWSDWYFSFYPETNQLVRSSRAS